MRKQKLPQKPILDYPRLMQKLGFSAGAITGEDRHFGNHWLNLEMRVSVVTGL